MSRGSDPAHAPPLHAIAGAPSESGPQPFEVATGPIRLVMLDPETAFTRVVARRADALGWQQRALAITPTLDELTAMRPAAVVVDPAACPGGLWDFLARAASALPDAGLLVVAPASAVAARARGLRLGADDWITKPAHPEEVVARIQAVVRRHQGLVRESAPEPVVAGELQIRPERFQAYAGGESLGLTRREYELLDLLARAAGRVLEREEIYRRVWGYAMVRGDRSVDVFVGKIRGKLAAASPGWRYVHTHVGVGYRFEAEPAAGTA